MTLLLTIASSRSAPLRWVADIVLGEMLGLSFEVTDGVAGRSSLTMDGRTLAMPSLFPDLDVDKSEWAKQIPALPLPVFDAANILPEADVEGALPVLFGNGDVAFSDAEVRCDIDIFGSIFLMLSRFEEVALPDRDNHDRFPASASLAWKGDFLYRPIVDEYVELLWAMMKRLWPELTRRRREGRIRVTCDVDQPFDRVGSSAKALVRSIGGDIGRRRSPGLAVRRTRNFFAHRRGDLRFDPYYTFDWYMDVCEREGQSAAFYFIPDHSAGAIDGSYEIGEPRVLALIDAIARRGHEIGVHGSYNSYLSGDQIRRERSRLAAACEKAGTGAQVRGNRQHYLRWDTLRTPDELDAAGFDYDTTGSFADRPGFRYGTSHPFAMWSWQRRAPLRLRQRPLILMEASVLSPVYLGLGHTPEAMDMMQLLKRRALKYGGDFTMLWHNSELLIREDRDFFQEIIRKGP